MRNLIIEIPKQTPLLNTWQRLHWSERSKVMQEFHYLIRKSIKHKPIKPFELCEVEIERHCSGVLPDYDGLYGGLKPILDCLVIKSRKNPHGLGVIVDDSPIIIKKLIAKPVRVKRAEHKTIIYITEIL